MAVIVLVDNGRADCHVGFVTQVNSQVAASFSGLTRRSSVILAYHIPAAVARMAILTAMSMRAGLACFPESDIAVIIS